MSWNDLSGAGAIVRPINQGNAPDGTENQGGANDPLSGTPWISDPPINGNGGYQFFIDFGTPASFDSIQVNVDVPPHSSLQGQCVVSSVTLIHPSFLPAMYPNPTDPWGGGTYTALATNDTDAVASVPLQFSVGPYTVPQYVEVIVYDHFTNQNYSCLDPHSQQRWVKISVFGSFDAYTVSSIQVGTGMVPSGSGDPGTQAPTAPASMSSDKPSLAGGLSSSSQGVIIYNSVFYLPAQDITGQMYVYKSTDLTAGYGATWASVGGACPVAPSYTYRGGTSWFDGDHTVTVAAIGDSAQVSLVDFDLSTETWGSAYGATTALGMTALFALFGRPDGSLLLTGQQDTTTILPAAAYSSGTWSAPFDVGVNVTALSGYPYTSPTPTINPPKFCMDDAGNIYSFFQLQGPTIIVDDAHAGPTSAWYGRAFYQRIALDNSTPSSTGDFFDFPGQDTAVPTGSAYPVPKDGDLAWNVDKGNSTGFFKFSNAGGDCFGVPSIVGTSIFIPVRRKIPGTVPFYDPNTTEQIYTYCTLYEGDGIPAPVWTVLEDGVDPTPPATSTNKCDAVGQSVSITNFLLVVYLYSNLAVDPNDPINDNTAIQSCVRLCYCAVSSGVPVFNWLDVTIFDRYGGTEQDAQDQFGAVYNAVLTMIGAVPIILADTIGGNCPQ